MGDLVVLNNCRRFPRAKLKCDVLYRDQVQSWRGYTHDIGFGGCRVAGYYPFPLGKPLALMVTHPSIDEPMVVIGKVVGLYGGAQNSIGLAFDRQWQGGSFEDWIRRLIAKDADARRAVCRAPNRLPLEAQLFRVPRPEIQRLLTPGEMALMQKLARSARPVSLGELKHDWGDEWERKARVVFDLIADGIVRCSLSQPGISPPTMALELTWF
jgi:hypothetical protein